jgi:hypothetical protein
MEPKEKTLSIEYFKQFPEYLLLEKDDLMITIEYCHSCESHNWSNHHNEEQYLSVATNIQDTIEMFLKDFPTRFFCLLKPIEDLVEMKLAKAKHKSMNLASSSSSSSDALNEICRSSMFLPGGCESRIGALEVQFHLKTGVKNEDKVVHILHSKLLSGNWPKIPMILSQIEVLLTKYQYQRIKGNRYPILTRNGKTGEIQNHNANNQGAFDLLGNFRKSTDSSSNLPGPSITPATVSAPPNKMEIAIQRLKREVTLIPSSDLRAFRPLPRTEISHLLQRITLASSSPAIDNSRRIIPPVSTTEKVTTSSPPKEKKEQPALREEDEEEEEDEAENERETRPSKIVENHREKQAAKQSQESVPSVEKSSEKKEVLAQSEQPPEKQHSIRRFSIQTTNSIINLAFLRSGSSEASSPTKLPTVDLPPLMKERSVLIPIELESSKPTESSQKKVDMPSADSSRADAAAKENNKQIEKDDEDSYNDNEFESDSHPAKDSHRKEDDATVKEEGRVDNHRHSSGSVKSPRQQITDSPVMKGISHDHFESANQAILNLQQMLHDDDDEFLDVEYALTSPAGASGGGGKTRGKSKLSASGEFWNKDLFQSLGLSENDLTSP